MSFRKSRFAGTRPYPRAALAIGAAGLVLAVSVVTASANPIADKRAQAQAILAEVQTLDGEVGAAAERYNGANYELQKLNQELADAQHDLRNAKSLQQASRHRVAARLRALYISGGNESSLAVLLGAQSLDEVLDRMDVAERVTRQDALIARHAEQLRERVTQRENEIAAARSRQVVVVQQRAAEKRAIEARLAEREQLLGSIKDEIAKLEREEAQRQVELRRRAELELQRQQRAAKAQAAARTEEAAVASSGGDGDGLAGAAPTADYSPPPADASKGAQVVAIAMQYLGIPYVWAAADPSVGFDCSGLTMYVYAQVGVSLPHYAAAQYQLGYPVSKDELQPGDLVFFRGLGHMGMYIGGGNMIHAPHTGDVVKISPLSDPYYVANWVGARRVL